LGYLYATVCGAISMNWVERSLKSINSPNTVNIRNSFSVLLDWSESALVAA
jgi:hypothetical protein